MFEDSSGFGILWIFEKSSRFPDFLNFWPYDFEKNNFPLIFSLFLCEKKPKNCFFPKILQQKNLLSFLNEISSTQRQPM